MSNIQRLAMIGLIFAVPGFVGLSGGQGRVTALEDRNGSLVYTNLAGFDQAPPGSGLDALIDNISLRHGVDPRLVHSVIEVESNFDRRAVSSRGAMGLMQLIPATGSRFGVRDFFDPAENISGGVRYLRFLLDMFEGNLNLSLAAYNSGENRVARLGRIPSIRETQEYVRKVNAAYSRRNRQSASPTSPGESATGIETRAEGQTVGPDLEVGVAPDSRPISSRVDERGVVRFSNIE